MNKKFTDIIYTQFIPDFIQVDGVKKKLLMIVHSISTD